MKIKLIFAWYDFWMGIFWDSKKWILYIFPIPMVGIKIDFERERRESRCNQLDCEFIKEDKTCIGGRKKEMIRTCFKKNNSNTKICKYKNMTIKF